MKTELEEAVKYLIETADLAGSLARIDGIRYGHRSTKAKDVNEVILLSRSETFDAKTKALMMAGQYIICSGIYVKAKQVQAKLGEAKK